jgi:hypothetical protein
MHFARSESALALPRVLHSPPGFRQTDTSGSGGWWPRVAGCGRCDYW